MNILLYAFILLEVVLGILSSLYIAVAIVVVPIYKVYRKIKYHMTIFE